MNVCIFTQYVYMHTQHAEIYTICIHIYTICMYFIRHFIMMDGNIRYFCYTSFGKISQQKEIKERRSDFITDMRHFGETKIKEFFLVK